METTEPSLWSQLSPEQQARIVAILVQMLLRLPTRPVEAVHDAT